MKFTKNKYTHNYYYGLDPHDDSDFLTITGNEFSGTATHGLICSERCDHLTITNNTSKDNARAGVQVHGIMLHRGVTDSLVEGNTVTNNRGGGVVVFDSVGNTIRNNTVAGNDYGLRFSVGTQGPGRLEQPGHGLEDQRRLHLQGLGRRQVHRYQRTPDRCHLHQQHLRRCRCRTVQDPGLGQVHLHRRVDRWDPGAEVRAHCGPRLRPRRDGACGDDVHPAGDGRAADQRRVQGYPRDVGEDRQRRLQQRDVRRDHRLSDRDARRYRVGGPDSPRPPPRRRRPCLPSRTWASSPPRRTRRRPREAPPAVGETVT